MIGVPLSSLLSSLCYIWVNWGLRGARALSWVTSYVTSKKRSSRTRTWPLTVWPLSRFLAAIIPHYATQHLPWAGCIRCVMSLMLAAAPREYSYWTNFTFKNLWFRNVNLCHISQPEKWQSQEWVSAFSQSPFPGWGFVKSLVEKMQMVGWKWVILGAETSPPPSPYSFTWGHN